MIKLEFCTVGYSCAEIKECVSQQWDFHLNIAFRSFCLEKEIENIKNWGPDMQTERYGFGLESLVKKKLGREAFRVIW